MNIVNKEELEEWLFQHSVVQGHVCNGIKGALASGEVVNIAFIDAATEEEIEVIYE